MLCIEIVQRFGTDLRQEVPFLAYGGNGFGRADRVGTR